MKHKPTKRWEFMKIDGETLKKIKQTCPRCGEGTFMAQHKEKDGKVRNYCGKCHYTVWP
ncbi:MAG: 30S ribosomal protein S27ae [Candidatus Aenigmarchaeota archaeon]|nr:30S ribosomal protein S27ae [Candidatus Aenigmarchaeota archaeon]